MELYDFTIILNQNKEMPSSKTVFNLSVLEKRPAAVLVYVYLCNLILGLRYYRHKDVVTDVIQKPLVGFELLNDIEDQLSVFVLLVQTTGGHGGLTFSMTTFSSTTISLRQPFYNGKTFRSSCPHCNGVN